MPSAFSCGIISHRGLLRRHSLLPLPLGWGREPSVEVLRMSWRPTTSAWGREDHEWVGRVRSRLFGRHGREWCAGRWAGPTSVSDYTVRTGESHRAQASREHLFVGMTRDWPDWGRVPSLQLHCMGRAGHAYMRRQRVGDGGRCFIRVSRARSLRRAEADVMLDLTGEDGRRCAGW